MRRISIAINYARNERDSEHSLSLYLYNNTPYKIQTLRNKTRLVRLASN